MFPGGRPSSIVSAKKLNYSVRNGNRCDLLAITTEEVSFQLNLMPLLLSAKALLYLRSRTL